MAVGRMYSGADPPESCGAGSQSARRGLLRRGGCWRRRGSPIVVPVSDQLGRHHPRSEAQRGLAARGNQMVAQLRYPGLCLSRGDVVAHAHEILTLLECGAVVGVTVSLSGDVLQAERMSELVQDRALKKADTVPDSANPGLPGNPVESEVAVGKQPKPPGRIGKGPKGGLAGLDDEVPLVGHHGRPQHPERQAARDFGRRCRSHGTTRQIPCAARGELELAVPVAHDDAHEIAAEGQPLGIRPRIELKSAVCVVENAIAGAVGARDIKVRRRFAPYKLDAVLEHEIRGSRIHWHEKRIAVPAVVNQSDFHGRVLSLSRPEFCFRPPVQATRQSTNNALPDRPGRRLDAPSYTHKTCGVIC